MSDFIFPSKDCSGCNRLISSPTCIYGGKCVLYSDSAHITKTTSTFGDYNISVEIDTFDFSNPNYYIDHNKENK